MYGSANKNMNALFTSTLYGKYKFTLGIGGASLISSIHNSHTPIPWKWKKQEYIPVDIL